MSGSTTCSAIPLLQFHREGVRGGKARMLAGLAPEAMDSGRVWVRARKTREARKAFWVPVPDTPEGLRSRWNRWLLTSDGEDLLKRWDAWERRQRARDGEEVAEEAVLRPTLHGLRSTAVVHRRLAGYTDGQISNDIGMSLPMVRRYSRFMDQRAAAETNIVLLEEQKKRGNRDLKV